MKKIVLSILLSAGVLLLGNQALADTDAQSENNHTASQQAKGEAIWQQFRAQAINCEDLSDEDFRALGEYFMGQMLGNGHESMNSMMEQMMGEEGEIRMHVVMGKRLSGCDSSASMPAQGMGFMPMMQMMGGGMMFGSPITGAGGFNMMGGTGLSLGGGIVMLAFWLLVIVGVVALIRWLTILVKSGNANGASALEILKKRYARGEINKREFEEKKKDIS